MSVETNGNDAPAINQQVVHRLAQIQELVGNYFLSREAYIKDNLDRRRNLDRECGYPEGRVNADYYQKLYDRDAVAARAVEVMPKETWSVMPEVYEDEDPDVDTPFEQSWKEAARSLRGEGSHYAGNDASVIFEYLKRLDVMAGIGRYGVLLLGLDDGLPLREPVAGVEEVGSLRAGEGSEPVVMGGVGSARPYRLSVNEAVVNPPDGRQRKLLYLRAFPESLALVTQYESNAGSPRFGQPVMYQLTLNDPGQQQSGANLPLATWDVHWTRVIHYADNLSTSECYGVPRMQQCLNRLLDLRKLYGGSAEMYWQGALPGLTATTPPQLGGEVTFDTGKVKDALENYMNGLQRFLIGSNMDVKQLAPTVVDPSPQIAVQIQAVCIVLGIPQRIFMGSERGELSSTQDEDKHHDRVAERQLFNTTPRLVVPLIDRLILVGVLARPLNADGGKVTSRTPTPESKAAPRKAPVGGGYSLDWPDLSKKSDAEKADIAVKFTQALSQYASSGAEAVMALMDFLTLVMGLSDEEAQSVVDNVTEAVEERDAEAQALADQHDFMPSPPPGFQHPPQPEPVVPAGKAPPTGNLGVGNASTGGDDCGTGAGGFKPGNKCQPGAEGGTGDKGPSLLETEAKLASSQHKGEAKTEPPKLSAKAERAKASHKLVDKDIQRYAEERNEPQFAKAVGGVSFPNGEPVDVAVPGATGKVVHGVELKTMVDNKNGKITMKKSAMERKAEWERKNKADMHTVVIDDQKVYNANGVGNHDESKRVYYYRRGYGSFRVATMHAVSSAEELKKLMDTPDDKLPKAAKRPRGQSRGKLS